MNIKKEEYNRIIFMGIVIISLGISFSTTLKDSLGTLGLLFIALGGLFFIIGMSQKSKEEERKNK